MMLMKMIYFLLIVFVAVAGRGLAMKYPDNVYNIGFMTGAFVVSLVHYLIMNSSSSVIDKFFANKEDRTNG